MKKEKNLPENTDELCNAVEEVSWDLRFNEITCQGFDFTTERQIYDDVPTCINPEPAFDEYH